MKKIPGYIKAGLILSFFAVLLVAGSSLISVNELLVPLRVDSLYVKAEEAGYYARLEEEGKKLQLRFNYSPYQLGLPFSSFRVKTIDNLYLDCWFIPSRNNGSGDIVLLLHDLHESRISMLETARQLFDRGFAICIPDMRAHGTSQGQRTTLGYLEPYDIREMVNYLEKNYPESSFAIMGTGLGAVAGLRFAALDKRAAVIIAQSPFPTLESYVKKYAEEKWGMLTPWLFPLMKDELEKELGIPVAHIDMRTLVKTTRTPTMFIVGSANRRIPPEQTRLLYDSSAAHPKTFYPVKDAAHQNIALLGGAAYFDAISVFIVRNLPPRIIKKPRNKRLA